MNRFRVNILATLSFCLCQPSCAADAPTATGPFAPGTVYYVETVHDSFNSYLWVVRDMLRTLTRHGDARSTLVFWPTDKKLPPPQLSLVDERKHEGRFDAMVFRRAAVGPPEGVFEFGLDGAAKIAASNNASLVLLLDSSASDLTEPQVAAIKRVAVTQSLSIVAVDHPADEFKPMSSGLVVCVSYGTARQQPTTRAARP